jgi:hypothetical protein
MYFKIFHGLVSTSTPDSRVYNYIHQDYTPEEINFNVIFAIWLLIGMIETIPTTGTYPQIIP